MIEQQIEQAFIDKLLGLKYEYRSDITDRTALHRNFRQKFDALNRVRLTDSEFARLLDEITTPDVFTAAKTLRNINAFTRDDGTPLNYTLVNLKDWCKNDFEVISQLRINTHNSHHRYDVILLINGVPCVQIELKTLGVNPRRAMEQIVEYKLDPGNGYSKTLLCFIQLFVVSNRDSTYYFSNNNARHFAFDADERFLPIYEFADEDNARITLLDDFAERFLKKCDLGRTISRYIVLLAGEQKLMVMRPYQVYAAMEGKNPTLVPRLRFPEFRGEEGWGRAILGTLSEVFRGTPPALINSFITYEANGLNWLKIGDVDRESKYVTRTAEKVRLEALNNIRVVNPGDLILSSATGFGRPYIVQIKACMNDGWIAITSIAKTADRDFLYYSFSTPCNQRYFVKNSAGLGSQNLSTNIIKALPVNFPSIPEQQKIAECLSSLDELITMHRQKVDMLMLHKKGLMQQLFPRERETQPRIRFPEFQNAAEWKVARLGDFATLDSGHTPNKSNPDYYNGGIKWVSLADSKSLDCGVISTTSIEISEKGVQNSSAVLYPAGTVLICREAGVGKSAIMGVPMAVSQHFIVWTCKPHLLSNWFLYYLLQNAKPIFERAAIGSTIRTIGLQFFIDLDFRVPSLCEQKRIASCLSRLDTLITLEIRKLEAFKIHKKGLMQQLFL